VNDLDRWALLDGPEPADLQPYLDTTRDAPHATPEDKEQMATAIFAAIDAMHERGEVPPSEDWPKPWEAAADLPDAEPLANVLAVVAPPVVAPSVAQSPWDAVSPPPVHAAPPLANAGAPVQPPTVIQVFPAAPAPPGPPPAPPAPAPRALSSLPQTAVSFGQPSAARAPQPPAPPVVEGAPLPGKGPSEDSLIRAMPSVEDAAGAGVGPQPALTFEQYASFLAELKAWPARRAAVYERYRVRDDDAKRALDDHWRLQFDGDPARWKALANAMATYTDHLRRQGWL
jgi:hypothetical protein